MPTNGDFKRLVRDRMQRTGERYTQSLAALAAELDSPEGSLTERTRSLLGQLANVESAGASLGYLKQLPDAERRAAAIEGLRHDSWRVRRTCAQLLDKVDLTPESLTALTRALDDEHPQVRRKAVHTLSCEHCKPNRCVVDLRAVLERAALDRSSVVRSMVVHVATLHRFDEQWAIDLVHRVAQADGSPKLRAEATRSIEGLRKQWHFDALRRQLPPDLVRKTERHAGHWIAIRDGRIVAVHNGQARVFRRETRAGANRYWVAPTGVSRPHIPEPVTA